MTDPLVIVMIGFFAGLLVGIPFGIGLNEWDKMRKAKEESEND
jgi:ABC-type nitrate/sulfonate/bicarbonate transport system permease component